MSDIQLPEEVDQNEITANIAEAEQKFAAGPEIDKLKADAKARRRVLMIKPAEFVTLFTKGLKFKKNTTVFKGIPEDAKLLGIAYDVRLDALVMVVSSNEYDEIPMTELPPRQEIAINMGVPKATAKKKK